MSATSATTTTTTTTSPSFLLAGLALAAVLLGVGCSDEGNGGGGTSALVAGDYRSTPASTFVLVDGTAVHLAVGRSELSVSAGCNTLGASFTLDGDVLVVDDLVSTMIGCTPELADQDVRLGSFLESRPVVAPSADGMTWTGDGGATIVLVDRAVAEPDRPLQGTRWTLESVSDGEAVVSAVGFELVTLVFDAGSVTLNTGCAEGGAAYGPDPDLTSTGGGIVLAPLTLVRSDDGCGDGVREAEAALTEIFGGAAGARVVADTLELRRGAVALTFRAG